METTKRALGAKHPDTLTNMHNLAFTWKELGRYKEALNLMEVCIKLGIRIVGTDHLITMSSRTALLQWQTEGLEISTSVNEDLDVY